jgi:hypothetical protein
MISYFAALFCLFVCALWVVSERFERRLLELADQLPSSVKRKSLTSKKVISTVAASFHFILLNRHRGIGDRRLNKLVLAYQILLIAEIAILAIIACIEN